MLVDASYLAWVRPARRVHFALSVGMTLTGVVLTMSGLIGSRGSAAVTAPVTAPVERTADLSVVGGTGVGGTGSKVPPPSPSASARPRPKPKPRPRPSPVEQEPGPEPGSVTPAPKH
ncbi:hypothetical protein GCM10009839_31210 [Catenulispora yoronensis]|uniref:Uncharacterized protein n=1 Tax=Catenulispora yoronensis TaxID=450799 RepID=A0ABN2U4S1_9ACTN